jgi:hypothetical protein
MPGKVAEPAGANELLLPQIRVLTALSMQGQMAGVAVGDARLPLPVHNHQDLRSVVAVHESCCQSRTNRRYEMLAPADGVGVGLLWLVLVWKDRPVARTQGASSEARWKKLRLAPVKEDGTGLKRLKRNPQPPSYCVPVATVRTMVVLGSLMRRSPNYPS